MISYTKVILVYAYNYDLGFANNLINNQDIARLFKPELVVYAY